MTPLRPPFMPLIESFVYFYVIIFRIPNRNQYLVIALRQSLTARNPARFCFNGRLFINYFPDFISVQFLKLAYSVSSASLSRFDDFFFQPIRVNQPHPVPLSCLPRSSGRSHINLLPVLRIQNNSSTLLLCHCFYLSISPSSAPAVQTAVPQA